MAKSTGGGSYLTLSGTVIPFTVVTPKASKTYDDSSDSSNYDPATGLVHLAQLAVSTQTTISIEGKIDTAIIPAAIVSQLYSNPGAVNCTIAYNATTPYGHGKVDVTEFEATIDPMKTLTFTATLLTNGVFTPNS